MEKLRKNLKKPAKPSVLADLGSEISRFARFFQLSLVFQCPLPSFPSLPSLPCSALWFLSGSPCPAACLRIALGLLEVVCQPTTMALARESASGGGWPPLTQLRL